MYPQHEFRNYAKSGSGTDFHRLCFDECYQWADLIILQRTHAQRRNIFFNLKDDRYLEWNIMQRGGRNYSIVQTNMGVCSWTGETFLDDFGSKSSACALWTRNVGNSRQRNFGFKPWHISCAY